ncbi:MAG: hypothetical protein ACJ8HQ_08020 [Chthoniobacterales bacterium]
MINYRLLIAAAVAASSLLPIAATTTQAQHLSVEIGDRPYYNRGPYYLEHGHRWDWVPGHWSYRHHQRVWIHGHYANRGRHYHDERVRVY